MKDIESLTETMLEFVRASVLERDPIIPRKTIIDWDELMDISSAHGLIAWVWDGICKLPAEQRPPRQQRINWGLSAQKIWDNYHDNRNVLNEIVEICRQNNIKLLVIKGISLSKIYPKPESRLSGDIDIFLYDDYKKGNDILAHGKYKYSGKHACFTYKGVLIENHHHFFYHGTDIQKKVDDYLLFESANSRLTDDGYYVLPNMAGLVHLLLHSIVHMNNPNEHITIRNIIDFAYYLFHYRQELDPQKCAVIMKRMGLEKAFDLFLQLSEWALSLNLKTYRNFLMEHSPDITNAVSLLLNNTIPFSEFNRRFFFKQINQRISYNKQTSWKYEYLPNKKIHNRSFFINQLIFLIKSFFRIPLNKTLRKYLSGL